MSNFAILITFCALFLSINADVSNGGPPGLGHHHKHHHKHHLNKGFPQNKIKSEVISGKSFKTYDGEDKSRAVFSADFETQVREELVEEQQNTGLKRTLSKTVDNKAHITGEMDINSIGDLIKTKEINATLIQMTNNSKKRKFHKKSPKKFAKKLQKIIREKRDATTNGSSGESIALSTNDSSNKKPDILQEGFKKLSEVAKKVGEKIGEVIENVKKSVKEIFPAKQNSS